MITNLTYLGDCLEVMPACIPDKSVDMVLADLPYGTTQCPWDTVLDLAALWKEYRRVLKPCGVVVLFAQTPFDKVLGASNLKWLKYEWIWEKTHATGHLNAKKCPMKAHENILVFYWCKPVYNPQMTQGHRPANTAYKSVEAQGRTRVYGKALKAVESGGNTDRYPRSVLRFPKDTQRSSQNDTQKPVALCEYLIRTYTDEGMVVLDNTAGSGTTGQACMNTGRRYIQVEKDPGMHRGCRERLGEFDVLRLV